MKYDLEILPEAIYELVEAKVWYEAQRKRLGDLFEETIWKYINLLPEYALLYQRIDKNYRQQVVKGFPFVIVYRLHKKKVVVVSIFHTSKNPVKKFRRKRR